MVTFANEKRANEKKTSFQPSERKVICWDGWGDGVRIGNPLGHFGVVAESARDGWWKGQRLRSDGGPC